MERREGSRTELVWALSVSLMNKDVQPGIRHRFMSPQGPSAPVVIETTGIPLLGELVSIRSDLHNARAFRRVRRELFQAIRTRGRLQTR